MQIWIVRSGAEFETVEECRAAGIPAWSPPRIDMARPRRPGRDRPRAPEPVTRPAWPRYVITEAHAPGDTLRVKALRTCLFVPERAAVQVHLAIAAITAEYEERLRLLAANPAELPSFRPGQMLRIALGALAGELVTLERIAKAPQIELVVRTEKGLIVKTTPDRVEII